MQNIKKQKIRKNYIWVFFLGSVFLGYSAWADSNRISLTDESLVELGMGYNSVTGEFGEPCVHGTALNTSVESPHVGLQRTEFELKKIENISQLKGELELNLSAVLGLGSYFKDPKVSYFSENDPSRNSVTLLVRSRVVTHRTGIRELQIKDEVNSLVSPSSEIPNQKNRALFLASCGNQFVQSISWGGEFLALLRFETETELKRQKIAGYLGALIAWFQGQGELSRTYSEEVRGISMSTKMIRKGGVGENPALDVEKIIEYARNFPNTLTAESASVALSAETRSYDIIRGMPRSHYDDLASQESVLGKWEQANLKTRTLISEWGQVQDHPELYESVAAVYILGALEKLRLILSQTEAAARACAQNLTDDCHFQEPDWPVIAVPKARTAADLGKASEVIVGGTGDFDLMTVADQPGASNRDSSAVSPVL
jgi:hypothetical protein